MPIHLLIIEADNRFRLNLSQRLRREGFVIVETTQPAEIELLMANTPIDVVLLGVDGLGRAGLDLIRRIRSVVPVAEIIIINDASQMDLSIEGMKLGAFDDFIIPFDMESLVTRIREAGRRKRENEKKTSP